MSNIIVVIGSVNAKQYESVRLNLLRQGLKPQIVRLSTDIFPVDSEEDYAKPDFVESVTKMFGVSQYEIATGMTSHSELYWELFRNDYGFDVKDVHSVILPPWGEIREAGHLTLIFDNVDYYRVDGEAAIRIEEDDPQLIDFC